ncbi:uncharacterized protein [Procambarus clarkii]|uniref:uncharacterized protein n=1 Tax=Procambarus clarkii TaxID=6728 RepID=UPI0037446910
MSDASLAMDNEAMSFSSTSTVRSHILSTHQDESPCRLPLRLSDYFASPASSLFDKSSADMSCLSYPREPHEPRPRSVARRIRFSHSTSTPLRLFDNYVSPSPSTSDSYARTMSCVPYSRPRQSKEMRRRAAIRRIKFPNYESTPRESGNDTSAMSVSSCDGAAGGASSAIYTPSPARLPNTSVTASGRKRFSFNIQDSLLLDLSPMRSWTTSPEDQGGSRVARPASHLRQDGAPETLLGELLALNLRDTPERPQGFLNSSHNLQKTPDSNLR